MLTAVKDQLEKQMSEKIAALPKDFNQTRFVQNALAVLNESTNLQKCKPQSVVIGLLKGAFLGLDFFRKECYLIPYGQDAQFQTDYRGEMKLAKKYSINPIKDVYSKLVREGDFFNEEVINGKQSIEFKPIPFNDGKIQGAFAVVYYKDGSMMYDAMSFDEIEETRKNFSKVPNGKAWKNSWGEMAKKTVMRRLLKLVEIDFENSEQDKAWNDADDKDYEKDVTPERKKSKLEQSFEKQEKEVKEEIIDSETGEIIPEESSELKLQELFPGQVVGDKNESK